MDRNEVMRLAREAGIIKRFFVDEVIATTDSLERFGALVAAAERESFLTELHAICSRHRGPDSEAIEEAVSARGKQQ